MKKPEVTVTSTPIPPEILPATLKNRRRYEWVEITNCGSSPIFISGADIRCGVGTKLMPGESAWVRPDAPVKSDCKAVGRIYEEG